MDSASSMVASERSTDSLDGMSPTSSPRINGGSRHRLGLKGVLPGWRSRSDSNGGAVGELSPRSRSESATNFESLSPINLTRKVFFPRGSNLSEVSRQSRQSVGSDLDPNDMVLLQKLESTISDVDSRNELVAYLLGQHQMPLVLRIRFLSAINELMMSEEDSNKHWTYRGRHLVKIFLDSKSKFQLEEESLPAHLVSDLTSASTASSLETAMCRAKTFMMVDLIKNQMIQAKLRED